MNPTQLSKAIGTTYQGVKKVVDGKSGAFSAENHSKAAAALGVNPDWLATGEGEMVRASTDSVQSSSLTPPASAPVASGPTPPGQRFDAVTEDEHNMLMAFRGMSDDDRTELTAEMEKRAAKWKELVAKVLAQTKANNKHH